MVGVHRDDLWTGTAVPAGRQDGSSGRSQAVRARRDGTGASRGRAWVEARQGGDASAAGIPTSGHRADDLGRPGGARRRCGRDEVGSGPAPARGRSEHSRGGHRHGDLQATPRGHAQGGDPRGTRAPAGGRRPSWETAPDPRRGARADRARSGGRHELPADRGGAPGGWRADGPGRSGVAGIDGPGGVSAGNGGWARLRSPPRTGESQYAGISKS